jgi:gliding motility-associated lipoprotein GldH
MKKLILITIAAIAFTSCNENRIFSDFSTVANDLQWESAQKFEVEVDVVNMTASYTMALEFRYIDGFSYEDMRVKVTEIAPSGAESEQFYVLKVRDEDGSYIGDPGLDIWDLEQTVEQGKYYAETGKYTYIIEHAMRSNPVNLAHGIGLIIDKTPNDNVVANGDAIGGNEPSI